MEHFPEELNYLKRNATGNGPPLVKQLRLFLDDDDVMKCRGRLENANVTRDTVYPILLPKKSVYTKLIIIAAHRRIMHGKTRATLACVREKFWIPNGRQVVKSIIRNCVTCLKAEGPCYKVPDPAPLPKSRVVEGLPFQTTGVDNFGPLFIRKVKKAELSEKIYVCLFTCAVTRAVHLELVEDLSADAFLKAFRRFVSRRDVPKLIISDNAKNFKSAAAKFKGITNSIQSSSGSLLVRGPPGGEAFMSIIGSIKRLLKKNIGKANLSCSELHTVILEVEAIINSRPLTYLYADIDDGMAFTPAHFLCGRPSDITTRYKKKG